VSDRLQIAAATLLWVAAIFIPLEWARPAWQRQRRLRPGLWADLLFFLGQELVFGVAVAYLLAHGARALAGVGSLAALRLAFATQPLALQVVEAVVLGDFVMYWGHRLQHAWGPLWRFHSVHHTSTHLDFLAAYREHPLDGLYTQTAMNLPAIVLGLRLDAVMGLIVFRSLWAVLIHSNARLPLGPLRYLFGSPELHHWHHARDRRAGNYANLAPYLDWIFGTYYLPAAPPSAIGVDEPHPRSYLGLLLHPFAPRRGRGTAVASAARLASLGGSRRFTQSTNARSRRDIRRASA
jgi:sterol desaturase/sphingolipid hydroxylase (fatty acid hydroxylase superfamily)